MKYRKEKGCYLAVLEKGDELTRALAELVETEGIQGGTVRGLGGVTNVTLGFFDTEKKEYLRKEFSGFYELANLVGNVSMVDGKPFCHLHAVISDSDMRAFAGHLFSAEISVTGEIIVTPGEKAQRRFKGEIGLNLLDL